MRTDPVVRAEELWSEGRRWDDVLKALRAEGFSKTDSIRASAEILRLPLADAKPLVHHSRVWSDTRGADERLHETLVAAIRAEVDAPRAR